MKKLEERVLLAKWKSYKTFKDSGEIRLHTASFYKEFNFTPDRTLTITEYNRGLPKIILRTQDWSLGFNNKKHYLEIPRNKLSFEIVTVNHTVLVLMNEAIGGKTFFAKEDSWKNHLQSTRQMNL